MGKQVAKFSDARKDLAAVYWNSVMEGEPMPIAIEGVLVHDHDAEISVSKQEEKKMWDPSKINMAHFKKDFDTSPNVIIYHSHNNMGRETHEKSLVKTVKAALG